MKENHQVSGRCLCGKVSFSISELNRDVVICHCEQCRRQTGHVVAATRVLDDNLDVVGAENLNWYLASDNAKRGFCKNCGSLLFWKQEASANTSVMAGSLNKPTQLTTASHIFTEFKGDYYEINDGLPQHKASDS